jgi:hypothetical protein
MADIADVEVKSAWLSKINWAQILTVGFTLLAAFGVNLPEDMKVNLIAAVTAIGGLATIVMKTWFTTTITPSSAAKL